MNARRTPLSALLLVLLGCALAPTAFADDDDDDDRGGRRHGKHKDKYWDGHCMVERKWKNNGDFEEKRKCKAPQPQAVVVQPAPVVVYPPWVLVQPGQPVQYRSGYEPAPVAVAVPQGPISRCNSDTVGRVLGGVAGGVIGNQVGGQGGQRALATIGGAVAGVLIGGEIGRRIDANDQACIGQTLELAPAGRRVEWAAPGGGQYAVVPGTAVNRNGQWCRPYDTQVRTATGWQTVRGTACRRTDGVWVTS